MPLVFSNSSVFFSRALIEKKNRKVQTSQVVILRSVSHPTLLLCLTFTLKVWELEQSWVFKIPL